MKNYVLVTVVLLMVFAVLATSAKAEGLKEGQWSLTMVTKIENMSPEMVAAMKQMENMPPEQKAMMQQMQQKMGVSMSMDGQGMTITKAQCITKQNPVPENKNVPDYCKQTHDINGNTVNFSTTCNRSDFQMESTGSMTFMGDTMQGQIKSHETRAGRNQDSTIDISGKYLGPCK